MPIYHDSEKTMPKGTLLNHHFLRPKIKNTNKKKHNNSNKSKKKIVANNTKLKECMRVTFKIETIHCSSETGFTLSVGGNDFKNCVDKALLELNKKLFFGNEDLFFKTPEDMPEIFKEENLEVQHIEIL